MTTPTLLKVAPGRYATPDGRYVIYNGHGWYRGTWTLWDKQADKAGDYGSKREAVAALGRLAAREGVR